jgi:hypothetical protein
VKRKSVITASRLPGFPSGSLNQRAGKEGVASPLITQVLFSYNLSFFKNTRIPLTFKNPLTPFPVTKIELRPIGKKSLEQGYFGSGSGQALPATTPYCPHYKREDGSATRMYPDLLEATWNLLPRRKIA